MSNNVRRSVSSHRGCGTDRVTRDYRYIGLKEILRVTISMRMERQRRQQPVIHLIALLRPIHLDHLDLDKAATADRRAGSSNRIQVLRGIYIKPSARPAIPLGEDRDRSRVVRMDRGTAQGDRRQDRLVLRRVGEV